MDGDRLPGEEGLPTPTAEDFAAADSAYSSFPDFETWAGLRLDEDLWLLYRESVETWRERAKPKQYQKAVAISVREAAIDTGAIEGLYEVDRGFTFSVATESAAWQVAAAEKGTEVPSLLAAQLAAYDLVLDIATKRRPVTEASIRSIHKVLTGPQETYRVLTPLGWQDQRLPKGQYKSQPNHPWRGGVIAKAYAPVSDTPAEMARLVQQLRRADFGAAHPVLQAAFAHYSIAAIHPFADGNGRVARAVASIYLYRSDRIPLLVYADQTAPYIAALEQADRGRLSAFADFVFDRGLSTLARVTGVLRAAESPERDATVAHLRALTTSVGGLSHQEVDAIAARLLELLQQEIAQQLSQLGLPAGVVGQIANFGRQGDDGGMPGYRRPINPRPGNIGFSIESQPPAQGQVSQQFDVLVSLPPRERRTFLVRRIGTTDTLDAAISEMHPDPVEDLRFRLRLFAQTALDEALAVLGTQAEASLKAAGYLESKG